MSIKTENKGSVGLKFPDALILYDGGSRYFGGDQAWFGDVPDRLSRRKVKKGCAVVAAANITMYLAASDGRYRPLYRGGHTKADFTAHLREVSEYVCPGIFGLWSAGRFARGVEKFAAARGVRLEAKVLEGFNAARAAEFIGSALENNMPVAMLIGFNRAMKRVACADMSGNTAENSFRAHWVTVTELSRGNIRVSSWGETASIALSDYAEGEFFRKALVYFV